MDTIYTTFYKQRVFTMEEARKIYKNYQVCKNAIYRLKKKKMVRKIKGGLYHIIPFDDPDYLPDATLIGSKLKPKYFFSHATALQLRAVMESKIVHISTTETSEFLYYGKHFKLINTPGFWGTEVIKHGPIKVHISTRERTLLDCLQRTDLVPSFAELIDAIGNWKLDVSKLLKLSKHYPSKKMKALLGFVLELFQEHWNVSDKDLTKLEKEIGKRTYYVEPPKPKTFTDRFTTKQKPKYDKRWKLIVPPLQIETEETF